MIRLYTLIFLLLPLLTQAQEFAYSKETSTAGYTHVVTPNSFSEEDHILANEMGKNIGKQVTLCSKVYAAKEQKDDLGAHPVFFVGGKYINEFIDIKIRLDDGLKFTSGMYRTVSSKNLCITGRILDEFGTSAIYLDSTNLNTLVAAADKMPPAANKPLTNDQPLKVISNAYLLAGPHWKDPVLAFLKAGSVIIAEQVRGNWAFVRVIEKSGENVEVEDLTGYMSTKPLGINNGTIVTPH